VWRAATAAAAENTFGQRSVPEIARECVSLARTEV
jgi:hypothetical protein